MRVPFVDLWMQHDRVEWLKAIQHVVFESDFILGKAVTEFEEAFAQYLGVGYAVGVASGTDALAITLFTLGIGKGAWVIVPANTFVATAFAVSSVGAVPVFVDCDDTYNMDVNQVRGLLASDDSQSIAAIIPVHLYGQPADMDPIMALADRYNLAVIEDACQAHGAVYNGQKCGSIGMAGCFSFYPSKNLGGMGDGGMIVTDDEAFAEELRMVRNYGSPEKYHHVVEGFNSRLDSIQAAVLNVKLPHLDEWNDRRREAVGWYFEGLQGIPEIRFQVPLARAVNAYHLFPIEVLSRGGLVDRLSRADIQTGVHYPIPIHLQQAFSDLDYKDGDFLRAERLARHELSLPMFPGIAKEQVEYVCEVIGAFYKPHKSTVPQVWTTGASNDKPIHDM